MYGATFHVFFDRADHIMPGIHCRSWSDPAIWQSLPEATRPALDPTTGQPAAGASVSIPPEWVVELDMDTAPLRHLKLDGLLTFAKSMNVSLTVETIQMTVGSLVAGNATHPHDGQVRLFLLWLLSELFE